LENLIGLEQLYPATVSTHQARHMYGLGIAKAITAAPDLRVRPPRQLHAARFFAC